MESPRTISLADVESALNDAVSASMNLEQRYERFLDATQEIRNEWAREFKNRERRFQLSPRLKVISEFGDDWYFFSNFGIQPQDFNEVISGAMEILKTILETDYSYLDQIPGDEPEKYQVFTEIPEYSAWRKLASECFHEVSHWDKYKAGYDRDPFGL